MPVRFDDIKFDPLTYKPYFTSFDSQYAQVIEEQHEAKILESIKLFENIVLQHDPEYEVRKECASKLVATGLYDQQDFDWSFLKFVKALLSVRDGKVHFLNQDNKWVWLVNYVWQHHIKYWLVFLYAVSKYEKTDTIFNSKLNEKRLDFKNNWKRDPKFKQDKTYYPLFAALLPELRDKLLK